MLKTNERIITNEDLHKSTDQVLSNAQKQPVVVTSDGKPTAYIVSVDQFDQLMSQLEAVERKKFEKLIRIADEQFENGQYKNLDDAKMILREHWKDQEPTE